MMKSLLKLSAKQFLIIASMILMAVSASAQVTATDTVCAATMDKVYGIMNANSTSQYAWYLSDTTAGTIDYSIAPNDSIIQIDWGVTAGTYTIYAVETTMDGCTGDSVALDVIIDPLPTALVVSDSVCPGFTPTLTFDLTGTGPWQIEYSDGSTTFNDVATASPHTATLPAYMNSQTVTVVAVTDANTCDADNTGLPTTPVHVYPAPASAPAIFHY